MRLLEYSREGSTRGFKTQFSEIQRIIKSHTHTCIVIPSVILLYFISYLAFVESANFSVIAKKIGSLAFSHRVTSQKSLSTLIYRGEDISS